MSTRNGPGLGGPGRAGWVATVVVAAAWAAGGQAQQPLAPVGPGPVVPAVIAPLAGEPAPPLAGGVVQASGGGCASCGSGGSMMPSGPGVFGYGRHGVPGCGDMGGCGGCGSEGCGENGCVPGRPPCETCEGQCRVTRIFCAFHNALCCPDPCYEPHWNCAASSALFVDFARPATITRLRWDAGRNLIDPDRSEFFWPAIAGKGPKRPETGLNFNELSLYQEVAADRFSFFISVPYRNLRSDVNGGAGGFGDLTLGTKTMFLDSEVLQATFQFATTIPVGVTGTGIGVGHVSLTPSLLTGLKLYTDTYFQQQLGYWIPISPSNVNGVQFAGGVFEFNHSINHVLCRPLCDTALIGSIESMGYAFTTGRFTDPNGVVQPAGDTVYFSVGPGLRLCVCDKVDVGFGAQFAVTHHHFADQLYRTELRWRF
jgi:hypothetical protein